MENEKILTEINKKIDGLEESLKYQIEAQIEILSGLRTISYLIYLNKE